MMQTSRNHNSEVLQPARRGPRERTKNYGLQKLRIGANVRHFLTHPLEVPSRTTPHGFKTKPALLKAGDVIDRQALDLSRQPDHIAEAARWFCLVPNRVQEGEINSNPWAPCSCMSKSPAGFESLEDLAVAHAPNDELIGQRQIHLVYAAALIQARPAKKEMRSKDTNELLEAGEVARRADVVILSDTEL